MKIELDTKDFVVDAKKRNGVVLKHKTLGYLIFAHTPDDGTDFIHFYDGVECDYERLLFSDRDKHCGFTNGLIYSGEFKFYWS